MKVQKNNSEKQNKLIHSQQEALIAAYLLNPGQRNYEVGKESSWGQLEKQLQKNNLEKIFQDIETPLIKVLEKMKARGIKLNLEWLLALSKKLENRIAQLIKGIHKQAGHEFNISSPIQLREVLFDELQIPTENLRRTGKTKVFSTDATTLEKLRGLHPVIELIFEYRELTKLKSTYVDALPKLVSKTDHRLHTSYSQTIAATGRLSSYDPNLQNIPIRTDLGNEVRKAFIAEKGKILLSLDYSQIELRIVASLSEDPEMMKIYKSGGDFHTATASKIFDVEPDKVTPTQRRKAKTINFSILYGVSAFGLSNRSEMEQGEAAEYIKKYYQVFSKLKKYIDSLVELAHKQEYLTNALGRIRYFPDINSEKFALRAASERQAMNMPIQSLAADIIKMAMIEIDKKYPEAAMLLSVHDELVFELKPAEMKEYAEKIKEIMETVYKLKVPIVADVKAGPNWAEMKQV
jgi:DNA polymerase-1